MSIFQPRLVVILLSDEATLETIKVQVNRVRAYTDNNQEFVIIITAAASASVLNDRYFCFTRNLIMENIPECAIFLGNNKIYDWIEIARKLRLYPEKDSQERVVFTA